MKLIPIIIPRPEVQVFINTVHTISGREIGRDLDAKGISPANLPGFVKLIDSLAGAGEGYAHLSFTFLIDDLENRDALSLIGRHDFTVTYVDDEAALITGTLKQWIVAALAFSKPPVREIINTAIWYFEQAGFTFTFIKDPQPDGTWLAKPQN